MAPHNAAEVKCRMFYTVCLQLPHIALMNVYQRFNALQQAVRQCRNQLQS